MPGWAGSRRCSFPHLKLCSLQSKPNLKNQGGPLFWLSLGSHARRVQFFVDTTHTCPGLHSGELLLEAGVQPQSFGAFCRATARTEAGGWWCLGPGPIGSLSFEQRFTVAPGACTAPVGVWQPKHLHQSSTHLTAVCLDCLSRPPWGHLEGYVPSWL